MSMIGNYLLVSQEELSKVVASPDNISEFLYEEKEEDVIDIDKAWHAIHFTLNGSEWDGEEPLFFAVMGGTPLGEEDVGYGPARALTPDQVKQTYIALSSIDEINFQSMYSADALSKNDIYPQIWSEGDEAMDYVVGYYKELVGIFEKASQSGSQPTAHAVSNCVLLASSHFCTQLAPACTAADRGVMFKISTAGES